MRKLNPANNIYLAGLYCCGYFDFLSYQQLRKDVFTPQSTSKSIRAVFEPLWYLGPRRCGFNLTGKNDRAGKPFKHRVIAHFYRERWFLRDNNNLTDSIFQPVVSRTEVYWNKQWIGADIFTRSDTQLIYKIFLLLLVPLIQVQVLV